MKTLGFALTPLTWPAKIAGKAATPHLKRMLLAFSGEAAKRRREANRLAATALNEYHRLGFSKKVAGKKKSKWRKVEFEQPLLLTRDELWCPVALPKLPLGVRTDDLRQPEIINSLSDRVNRAVRIDYLANGKMCVVIGVRGAKFPDTYSYNSYSMPPSAPALALPLGLNAEGENGYINLADCPHLLVAGTTGKGKTTFIHALIQTLLSRNGAQDIELWLIDLKGGAELGRYDVLLAGPQNPNGIVRHLAYEPEAAVNTLNLAVAEIERRNKLMRQYNASNLDDLNQVAGLHLRRIVLVFDEIAQLMLNRQKMGQYSLASWGENLMSRIASLGRSAGVHAIIATQFVQSDVISSQILANFESRLCFGVADWRKSQLVIESSDADGLPRGRALLRMADGITEYQTCYITPQQTRLELARIKRYGAGGGLGDADIANRWCKDAQLLLSVACQQFNGEFSRRKLLQADGVRGVVGEDRFNNLASSMEREGVLEPGKSNRPRRVARGYFNRPELLEIVYKGNTSLPPQEPHHSPTTGAETACGGAVVGDIMPHQEGKTTTSEDSDAVACGGDMHTTPTPMEEEQEIDIGPFKQLLEKQQEEDEKG